MAHKDPGKRAHMWERAPRPDEVAVGPAESTPYPYELPRHVHRAGGVWKKVETPEDCDAALDDGWALLPPSVDTP